jgi:myosin-crossreactive antigen
LCDNEWKIKEIQIYNALGQYVGKAIHNASATMTMKLGNDRGVYILRIIQNDGTISSKRVVVK